MNSKRFHIDRKWKEYALGGCISVLFGIILLNLKDIFAIFGMFKSIFLGIIFAYIINPLAVFISNKLLKDIKKEKINWILSVIISIILVLAVVFGLLIGIIPQLVDNVSNFLGNIDGYIDRLISFANKFGEGYGNLISNYIGTITGENGLIQKAADFLSDNLGKIASITANVGSAATTIGVGIIFTIYFMISKNSILAAIQKLFKLLLSPLSYTRAGIFMAKFNTILSKYIICEIVDALIVGVCTFIFMIALGLPNALLISVVCGVTNLAPTFGPIVGLVVGAFILLLVDPSGVLPFIIFTLILQAADGYVIKPKFFGGALNVPGVLILVAIIVFGKIFGVGGMLLAIPLAAIIDYLYQEVLIQWLEMRKELEEYKKNSDAQ